MTRSAASLTLALALVVSTPPVTAEERSRSLEPGGPLARAIAREGARLALVPQGRFADLYWARVRRLEPGRDITVTIRGSRGTERHFVSADDSSLTVLNLTDPALPVAAARALREIASRHHEYFEGATKGGTFIVGNVRLASAGVFVADRKVADLQRVVETSARIDVAEIRTRQKGQGVWGHLGLLGGYFVGAMGGGIVAGLACQAVSDAAGCDTGAFLGGALVGGIGGAVHGFRAANRETVDVIYRAP